MAGISKCLMLLGLTIVLTGCKLAVIVIEGGYVQSIASGFCQPTAAGVNGNVCIHEVSDSNYSETFTAVAAPGYFFVRWNSGKDFVCGGSTNPVCVVSNVGTAGNAGIEAIIASNKIYQIMPIFEEGRPITDTVTADGKEWAQVDLFLGLSWDDIFRTCPVSGICDGSGTLNGYDMRGWRWASVNDVNSLLNSYGVTPTLGPGPNFVILNSPNQSTWAPNFFTDGWRVTDTIQEEFSDITRGKLIDVVNRFGYDQAAVGGMIDVFDQRPTPGLTDEAFTGGSCDLDTTTITCGGAWFYRHDP